MALYFPPLAIVTIPRSCFSGRFQHLLFHMFGDSSDEVFIAVAFVRRLVTFPPREIKTEQAFFPGKECVRPTMAMAIHKFGTGSQLTRCTLEKAICRKLSLSVDKVLMWTDSTFFLQWINSIIYLLYSMKSV